MDGYFCFVAVYGYPRFGLRTFDISSLRCNHVPLVLRLGIVSVAIRSFILQVSPGSISVFFQGWSIANGKHLNPLCTGTVLGCPDQPSFSSGLQ